MPWTTSPHGSGGAAGDPLSAQLLLFSSLDLTWSCLGISTSCRAGSLFPKSFNVLLSTFGRRICLISSSWPRGGIRPHTWLCSQIVCPSMSQPACSHRCSPQDAGRALGLTVGPGAQLSQSHGSLCFMVVFSSQRLGSHHTCRIDLGVWPRLPAA